VRRLEADKAAARLGANTSAALRSPAHHRNASALRLGLPVGVSRGRRRGRPASVHRVEAQATRADGSAAWSALDRPLLVLREELPARRPSGGDRGGDVVRLAASAASCRGAGRSRMWRPRPLLPSRTRRGDGPTDPGLHPRPVRGPRSHEGRHQQTRPSWRRGPSQPALTGRFPQLRIVELIPRFHT
jgi:hypothetical protein